MKNLMTTYQNNLLYVFDKQYVKNNAILAIVKDGTSIENSEEITTLHYSDDFESLLNFKVPTKNRRKEQMISLQESLDIIDKIAYGVLSFTYDEIPYSIGLNHIHMDGKIFFHSAKAGFKLHAIDNPVSYLIIEDLGINEAMSTHNHNSVWLQGTLKTVEDVNIKKEVLAFLMKKLAPSNHKEISDAMVMHTNILVFDTKYLHGKSHIR